MVYPNVTRRICAGLLSISLVLVAVPPIGALESVFGTIQVSGPAWVASDSTDWSRLSATRPLVAGDRLRTGSDGYLLADMGEAGVVGLYGDAEVTASDAGRPIIDVHKGKVAFHLSPKSDLMLQAKGAGIASDSAAADGYVEYDASGTPVVVVEEGSLMVQVAGMDRRLGRGEKLALNADAQPETIQLAANDDDRKKAAGMATSGGKTYGGVSGAGWVAIGTVVAATGAAVAVAETDDDDNGSE
jgi:hypothetical protein